MYKTPVFTVSVRVSVDIYIEVLRNPPHLVTTLHFSPWWRRPVVGGFRSVIPVLHQVIPWQIPGDFRGTHGLLQRAHSGQYKQDDVVASELFNMIEKVHWRTDQIALTSQKTREIQYLNYDLVICGGIGWFENNVFEGQDLTWSIWKLPARQ